MGFHREPRIRPAALPASLALLLAPAAGAAARRPAGFWLASASGQVFAYGKARSQGSEYRMRIDGALTSSHDLKSWGSVGVLEPRHWLARFPFGWFPLRPGGLR